MSFDKELYTRLELDFNVWQKAIARKNASKDATIIRIRTKGIIHTFNEIIKILSPTFSTKNEELKRKVRNKILKYRERLIDSLKILNAKVIMPNDITEKVILKTENVPENATMAEAKFKYINNISKIICSVYKGDPNGLNAFIQSIELANEITDDDQQETLVKFIKTKLEGTALEAIPTDITTAKDVIDALKSKIKTENVKVVVGRYMALRAERSSLNKFQKDAEELSDQLRRAYISEGMSKELAEKMTIEKTVDMCRLSARTNLVKSVLASTDFKSPKDVLAKLITESTAENSENSILYYNTKNNFRSNFQRNFRGNNQRGNGYRRNFNNYYNNNNHNYRNNYNNRGKNFHQNKNKGNREHNSNYHNNNRNNHNNNRNNDRNQYVRVVNQENELTPSSQRGTTRTVTMKEM